MIAIVDYEMGNLRSAQKACEHMGVEARITDDHATITNADGLILPGVGAFRACYRALESRGLVPVLQAYARSGRPLLGVCIGMQLLFTVSEEFGESPGLDIVPGRVVRFPNGGLKVPHMGWNALRFPERGDPCPLFAGLPPAPYMYFVHSYYAVPNDAADIAASAEYGVEFTAAVGRDNVFGTQFHPEKSQAVGLQVIANFGRIVAGALRHA